MKPKVVVIVGPTAGGKSACAVALARQFNGEIVSADSRQVYRGLNLGTGKITKPGMAGIPHHLLSVASPQTVFSADEFKRLAESAIHDIVKRKKTPIIVGGTGFYVDVLLGRYSLPSVPPNLKLRKKLESLSTQKLVTTLFQLDSRRAQTIDQKNRVRLVRAIEIATSLGSVPPRKKTEPFSTLWIGLLPESESLKKKIRKRLRERLRNGMIKEVKQLHQKGLSWKRMEDLGLEYRYLSRFCRGLLTKKEMLEALEREINRYAKRQKQWFQTNKDIVWFDPDQTKFLSSIEKKVKAFLKSSSLERERKSATIASTRAVS